MSRTISEAIRSGDISGRVRIGCKGGKDFLYIGEVEDLDFASLDEKTLGMAKGRAGKLLEEVSSARSNNQDRQADLFNQMRNRLQELVEWKPLAEREITSIDRSTVNDDLIIIVEGNDGELAQFDYPADPSKIPEERCVQLVEEIYRQELKELRRAYMALLEETSVKNIGLRRRKIFELERWFRKDPYGILADPDGMIEQARKLTAAEFDEKQKGKQNVQ